MKRSNCCSQQTHPNQKVQKKNSLRLTDLQQKNPGVIYIHFFLLLEKTVTNSSISSPWIMAFFMSWTKKERFSCRSRSIEHQKDCRVWRMGNLWIRSYILVTGQPASQLKFEKNLLEKAMEIFIKVSTFGPNSWLKASFQSYFNKSLCQKK